MKIDLHKILYATIKTYEIEERLRRDDYSFDAFIFLSKRLGYKHPSILRKMCEPRGKGYNTAKIGVEDAMMIMTETKDYRMLEYIREELKRRKNENEQMNLIFSKPQTDL